VIGGGWQEDRLGSGTDPVVEARIVWLAVGLVAFFAILLARLFYLQIVSGADLLDRSVRNSVRTERVEASRGEIVDREGRTLVTSRPSFRVAIVHSELANPEHTFATLGFLLGEDPEILRERVGKPRGSDRFRPIVIADDLNREQLARVEAHRFALPGVVTTTRPRRFYVEGVDVAHLLGSIGEISARQLEKRRAEGYRPGDIVGQSGLEQGLETHLRGRKGGRNFVVDVSGREVEVLEEVDAVPGGRAVLTLDLDLQQAAVEAFRKVSTADRPASGAVVALDPRNGDVLALVSEPAYDPNLFSGIVERDVWHALREDEGRPLQNRALAGHYSPGSTYKAILAAAALEDPSFDPKRTHFCPGYFQLGRHVYRCWKRDGHGPVDLATAILRSCDVYFYKLGLEIGIDRLADIAGRFGLGKKTGIGLEGETTGLVPTREWKERIYNDAWQKGETVLASIGQGFSLVTPIQLAVAYAAIGNRGGSVVPRLVNRLESWDGELVEEVAVRKTGDDQVIDSAVLETVSDTLVKAVHHPQATGKLARVPGVVVAGKTGTTQVVSLDLLKAMEPDGIPVRFRDHALFVGFAPAEAPEIVVAVVVEHGESGGAVAAPIAQAVFERYFSKQRDEDEDGEARVASD